MEIVFDELYPVNITLNKEVVQTFDTVMNGMWSSVT